MKRTTLLLALALVAPFLFSPETTFAACDIGTGTITITSDVSTTWTLTNGGTATTTGSGTSASYAGMPTGTYRVSWGTVPGYAIPTDSTKSVCNGQTTDFSKSYASLPTAATNLSATPGACGTKEITLDWDAGTNVTKYYPGDETHSFGYGTVVSPTTVFTHTGLTPDTYYGYSIKSWSSEGYIYSGEVWAKAPSASCAPPNLRTLWVDHYNGTLAQNETIEFQAKFTNEGGMSTGVGFDNDFTYQWGGTSGVWAPMPSGVFSHGPLAVSGYDYDFVYFAPDQSGTLYVQHCSDSNNDVDEGANESPNCAVSSFEIAPASCIGSWGSFLGNEGDTFMLGASTVIRYGEGDNWVEGTYSGSIECTNTFFGTDPSPGVKKMCIRAGAPIVNNCWLEPTSSGGSDGMCATGYLGSCPTSCSAGTWTEVSNTCHLPVVDDFRICTPDELTCANEGDTFIVATNTPLKVMWETVEGDNCDPIAGAGFETGGLTQGDDTITSSVTASTSTTYQVACNYNGGIADDASIDVVTLQDLPVLTADVTTVRAGNTIELSWDTNNNNETSCTLTGGGIDGGAILGNGSGDDETGTEIVTINGRTTFILTCGSLSSVKTIEIVPIGWEG